MDIHSNKTTIELTDNDARLFKWFQQYYDIWERVFEVKNGVNKKVVLHLNAKAEIRKKEFHEFEEEKRSEV